MNKEGEVPVVACGGPGIRTESWLGVGVLWLRHTRGVGAPLVPEVS